MRIRKYDDDILISDNKKTLAFRFGGNGDLYWVINNEGKDTSFTITKENYALYKLFDDLYSDIENINIFERDDEIPDCLETEDEKWEYIKEMAIEREEEKERYYKHNRSNYSSLFDKENKTITWHSDETAYKVCNVLTITKKEDTYELLFSTQPHINGYDEDFHSDGYIPIRFRNSGSRYDPFNVVFMRMYNNLKEIDDVKDIGHQMHMAEYIYTQEHPKKLSKKNNHS